jgi:hypothetical protein
LLINAQIQQDGENVRGVAQSVEALEDILGRMAADLEIAVETPASLAALRPVLDAHAGGTSRVRLIAALPTGMEVEIALPVRCRLDPSMILKIKALAGLRDVHEA